MNTRLLLPFALIVLGMTGCQDDDRSPVHVPIPAPQSPSMQGDWYLVSVMGDFTGGIYSYDAGEITWQIDTENHTVTVMNYNQDPDKVDVFESGTYEYQIASNIDTPELCDANFIVDNHNLGCFAVTAHEITTSQVEVDGYALRLVRPEHAQ